MARLNQLLVTDEVRRVIAEAIKDRDSVYPDQSASRIALTYPQSGQTAAEISELIIQAAFHAGVPVHERPRV
jgi:hypothetical protein